MLATATKPEVSELIPQDHPEWQNLRSGKVTGSSLAEALGLFEQCAGKALSGAGVSPYMRDHNKLLSKVTSLQNPKQAPAAVDAQTQVYFDWGHKHEANGILSYLCDNPKYTVHEVGFVLMDPSLQRLPEEVRRGIAPADLPVIGSSPDGKSCKPYVRILPQYFAQAQLNMLVTDSQACHLLCYTVRGGSAMFTIALHKQWCNQMLHWVAQLNTHYIVKGLNPPENVFWEQEAYQQFVKLTKEACEGLGSGRVSVPSEHGSEYGPLFWAAAMEAEVVPNTPEEAYSQPPQLQQAPQPQQQQAQQLQQHPPHWQGQFQGAANSPAPLQGAPVAPVSMEYFGGRAFPAAMSQRVRVRLHHVVAKCSSYVRDEDFDGLILDRLSRMPEWRAMSVLQQAEDANWPVINNNTRMIMSWCKKHDI
ncbi:hypothetical protein WJX82_005070 [Trebouxia sp. C0006]